MTQTQHTPGPWTTGRYDNGKCTVEIVRDDGMTDTPVIAMLPNISGMRPLEEERANIDLIRLAPETAAERVRLLQDRAELVGALKGLYAEIAEIATGSGITEDDTEWKDNPRINAARALLSRMEVGK